MNHSFGMSYANAGGQGFTQGYYLNSMTYRFNSPVTMRMRLGVTNNPFAQQAEGGTTGAMGMNSLFQNAEFFGGMDLDWRPRDNMLFRLSVDRLPAGMYYSPYSLYNPWGMYADRFSPYGVTNDNYRMRF